MTAHPVFYYYLWIAPHVLQIVLAVLMIRKSLVREFPTFFAYVVFEILQFVTLASMATLHTYDGYAYVWYAGETVSAALRFAVIREIFTKVFENYSPLKQLGNQIFRWATVLLVIAAVLVVAYTPGNEMDRVSVAINVIDRTVSIVQFGLLLLLLILSRFLRFNWRSYAFGIALGLGVFAGLKLVNWTLSMEFAGADALEFFTLFMMAAYHCCVLFWVVTLLLPQPQRIPVSNVSSINIDHWNNALERFLQS
jgi:hypothetical protein